MADYKVRLNWRWENNGADDGTEKYRFYISTAMFDRLKQLLDELENHAEFDFDEFNSIEEMKAHCAEFDRKMTEFANFLRTLSREKDDYENFMEFDVVSNQMNPWDIEESSHARDFNNEFSYTIDTEE